MRYAFSGAPAYSGPKVCCRLVKCISTATMQRLRLKELGRLRLRISMYAVDWAIEHQTVWFLIRTPTGRLLLSADVLLPDDTLWPSVATIATVPILTISPA